MKHIKIAIITLIIYMHTGYAKIAIQNLVNAPVDIQVIHGENNALIFAGNLKAGEIKILPDNFWQVGVKVIGFKDNERKVPFTLAQDGESGSYCHMFWILRNDPKLQNGDSGYIATHGRVDLHNLEINDSRAKYGAGPYYFFQNVNPRSRAYFGQPQSGVDFCR